MTAKCLCDLCRIDAAAIVGYANQVNAAVFDLDCDGSCPCVNGILRKLLDHIDRALHNLSCRNAVDGIRTENMNFCHENILCIRILCRGKSGTFLCHEFGTASQRFFSSDCRR